MAQTRRKRTRKHRGNAAGIVERPAHNSRGTAASNQSKGRAAGKADARRRRAERFNRPPTWKGAAQRASVAAGLFAILVMVLFKETIAAAVSLALVMLVIYIPLSFVTDRALFNWRRKRGLIPPGGGD
jgi:hypothetical protein